jgi:hypothetical protein
MRAASVTGAWIVKEDVSRAPVFMVSIVIPRAAAG